MNASIIVSPLDLPPPRLTHTLHHHQTSSVLGLTADSKHIFAGCQTGEINVWDRCALQIKTTLHGHTGSVLALEIDREREWLFSSSSDSTVRIWSTRNLTPVCILTPHLDTSAGDIFSLAYSPTLQTLYFGCQNTSLQWYNLSRSRFRRATAVTQPRTPSVESDASFRHRPPPPLHPPDFDQQPNEHESISLDEFHGDTGLALDRKKWHRFFDNTPRLGRPVISPAVSFTPQTHSGSSTPSHLGHPPRVLQVPPQNIIHSAHYGYIYCMALLPSPLESAGKHQNSEAGHEEDDVLLITGSGDESVKIWKCTSDGPVFLDKFECNQGGVLSLVARDGTIYAGCQDGCVAVWDLETKSLVRLILAQENSDVLAMSMINTDLYTCCANGWVQRWSAQFTCTASWHAHSGIILSSIVTRLCPLQSVQTHENGHNKIASPEIRSSNEWCLITAGNDNDVKIWEISGSTNNFFAASGYLNADGTYIHDPLVKSLSSFVAIPSVSNSEQHREDCRQAGLWLRRCLSQLGADAKMIATGQGTNPLVLATFKGVNTSDKPRPRPRILFYGHYDVISAPRRLWSTSPFSLTGTNGYLYGRGVTDNKGPILAAAYAASDLLRRRTLGCDVVFLIEGEEEAGSGGFEKVVKEYKDSIGEIDALLVSNSSWIGEDTPCITYGLRGVVHATIDVSNSGPDLHSGVEGGSMDEPMSDMVKILAELVSTDRKVLIPGFYDRVRPRTSAEDDLFTLLSTITNKPAESLSSRWREPTLSIHSVETSGPGNSTVIPAGVRAKVSIRVVPDQTLQSISDALVKHVDGSFEKLKSSNSLKVSIDRTADWWLGDLESRYFKMLEKAVNDEWGITPLRIREGGSIPSVPFLEKEFGCPGLHLPMGQSSDQAHLANERISLLNLRRGKSVVERFLLAVSSP